MKVTETVLKALEIIDKYGSITPKYFARHMWPDSEGWSHHVKCGNGSHRGGGMYMAAGGYLGKLNKEGWIRMQYTSLAGTYSRDGYILTSKGREVLTNHA